jgi:DNA polymerase III epsilon subunit-like protein
MAVNQVSEDYVSSRFGRYLCVFDFETTGLPLKSKIHSDGYYPPEELVGYDTSRAVSLAWVIYDNINKTIEKKNHIIYPDGFVSSPGAFNVHGITDDYAKEVGVPISVVLNEFAVDLEKCGGLVGYNVSFDYHILLSECYRCNNRKLSQIIQNLKDSGQIRCALKLAKNVLMYDANFKPRRKFYPKLEETYRYLFNQPDYKSSHDALDDTIKCGEIYYELLNRGNNNPILQNLVNNVVNLDI